MSDIESRGKAQAAGTGGQQRGQWITAGVLGLAYAALIGIQVVIWWGEFGWPMTMPEDPLMIVGGLLAALAGVLVFMRFTLGVPWLLLASLIASEVLARGLSPTGWYWFWPWEFAGNIDNVAQFGPSVVVVFILRGIAPYVILVAFICALVALIRSEFVRPKPSVSVDRG